MINTFFFFAMECRYFLCATYKPFICILTKGVLFVGIIKRFFFSEFFSSLFLTFLLINFSRTFNDDADSEIFRINLSFQQIKLFGVEEKKKVCKIFRQVIWLWYFFFAGSKIIIIMIINFCVFCTK